MERSADSEQIPTQQFGRTSGRYLSSFRLTLANVSETEWQKNSSPMPMTSLSLETSISEVFIVFKNASKTVETSSAVPVTAAPTTAMSLLGDEFQIEAEDLCETDTDMEILLTILITSAPTHQVQRNTIRQTWGHFAMRRDIRIAFVVGVSGNQKVEDQIAEESRLFRDIIQISLVDNYFNLTSKVRSMLRWTSVHCSNTQFLLKTDDDMFINIPVLLDFLRSRANISNVIYGRIATKWKPARSKKSKWFVSKGEWESKFYPNFVTGPAYLMTFDCVTKLLAAAEGVPLLKLEDVFTTGILAEKAGIRREGVKKFSNIRPKINNTCALSKLISAHDIKSSEMFDIWRRLQDPGRKPCKG
ncbi:unnamed protein product [Notodromas monacha]|uniref:Hexosyltransferase n=1 Tax=Notodromas monacha TaxID=399045 RepID=A0A7R9BFB9_9CRUS|nr:unnamed protein product [Notodromas monacha]CAG0913613.1 unnamed protein product [Notodromas monacha]